MMMNSKRFALFSCRGKKSSRQRNLSNEYLRGRAPSIQEIGVRQRHAKPPIPTFFFAFSKQCLNLKQSMPSGPHMGRHFIMTPMTVVWEGRQSFGFLHCGILRPLPPPTPAPTPCARKLFSKFSTLDLHMPLCCFLAKVSLSPLQIMGVGANQDSCQDDATVNHGQTNPKQALR